MNTLAVLCTEHSGAKRIVQHTLAAPVALDAGLEEGSRLPSALQLDPGTTYNAGMAATMQKLPNSLAQALNAWDGDSKLQVGAAGQGGFLTVFLWVCVWPCQHSASMLEGGLPAGPTVGLTRQEPARLL